MYVSLLVCEIKRVCEIAWVEEAKQEGEVFGLRELSQVTSGWTKVQRHDHKGKVSAIRKY